MASKRLATGWRGFSTAKESAYGTQATVNRSFNFEGPITDIEPNEVQSDEDEITGSNEATKQEILNYKLDGVHQQRAMPHNLAHFLSLVMGKITSSQPNVGTDATVYDHYIEREVSAVQLPSLTMVEFDGIAAKQFVGIFGKTVKISGEQGDFVKMEASFGGQGKEEASVLSKPAVIAESYLKYADVSFSRGGNISGSVGAGNLAIGGTPTDFKTVLRSFEWMINNDAQTFYEMGSGNKLVSRAERGDKFIQELSAVLEMQDDSHKTGLVNGTEYVLNIPITGAVIPGGSGSYNFAVNLIFPKVVYKEAKKDRDGNTVIVNANFMVLDDPTHGSVIVKITNEQSAYLS